MVDIKELLNYEKIEIEDKKVIINGKTVLVKQFIPLIEKLSFIENVIDNVMDGKGLFNTAKYEIVFNLQLLYTYTDIQVSEEEKLDFGNLYELLKFNGIFKKIIENIPEEEYNFLQEHTMKMIDEIYKYFNSFLGIMERAKTDYGDMNLNIEELVEKIKNIDSENLDQVNDIMAKLG